MNCTSSHSSRLSSTILAIALLALFAATPASATIYQFAIPVSAIEAMFPANYAVYDVYIRTSTGAPSDGCVFSCNFLPSPLNVGATPPAAPQAWTDVVNGKNTDHDGIVGPGDAVPYQSIRFTYGAGSPVSVIVKNSNTPGAIVGNTVNGQTVGGVILNGSQFVVNIASATDGLAGQSFSIFVYMLADQFSSGYISASGAKGANFHGNVSVTAQLTPEPVSIFMGGSGLLLFVIAGLRNRRKTS